MASVVAPSAFGIAWEMVDRGLTICSVWVVALVVYRLRQAREQAEHERRRALDALEAKGRFLSSASHDLRQPLQSLVLFVGVLQDQLRGRAAQRMADTMAAAIEALRGLLDNVLDLSKLDAGVLRVQVNTFDLGGLLQRLGDEYRPRAEAKGKTLRIVPTTLWVVSDATLVERVLRNLLENALTHAEAPRILVGCRRRGEMVRIDVIDTGRGIPAADAAHIFEEFYQVDNPQRSRERGHGLGLAIVKRIADQLGHRIDVRSSPGRGSCFSLWLPTDLPRRPPAGMSGAIDVRAVPEIWVLVVEDDPLVLPAVKLSLENLGCRVAVAECGSEAVTAAQAHPLALVISDFRLPGANGIQTISAIRSTLGTKVPASLLTGDFSPSIETQCRRLDVGLLRKPVRQEDLATLVTAARNSPGRISPGH